MSTDSPSNPESSAPKGASATRFFLRGLGIALPAILTVVILIWIAGVINSYIISPIGYGVRFAISLGIDASQPSEKLVFWDKLPSLDYCEKNYKITPELKTGLEEDWNAPGDHRNPDGSLPPEIPVAWLIRQVDDISETPRIYVPFGERAVPYRVYRDVAKKVPDAEIPSNSRGVYMEFVTIEYFGSQFLLSSGAIAVAVVLMYFIGRLVTVRIGAWFVQQFESVVLERLPVISTIYSAVKQVTDFLFSERQIEYNRVVAIEYPRRGIWSLGFVTGDSMLEMTTAAGEPLVTVLIPTSPMPVTGYTMSVPRRELIDLNVTIDQAFQFCVSCGVLVPPHQQVTPELLQQELAERLTRELTAGASKGAITGAVGENDTDNTADNPSPDSSSEQTESTT
jgi:uncharacterized membrane protein